MRIFIVALLCLAPMVQHGPDEEECSSFCAPKGFEEDVVPPEGVKVITCKGDGGRTSCAEGGAQCNLEHMYGCSLGCKKHCCSCCGI